MTTTPAAAAPETDSGTDNEAFEALDRTLRDGGPAAAVDLLIRRLDEGKEYWALLDALLLKARVDLGLPLVQAGGLNDVPEPLRSQYEERYVTAIRQVGQKMLDAGEIAAAWPYFRAIGETEPVARAIDAYVPADGDERLGAVIEAAFNQGANPKKGFELILNHYGSCSAITAFEHLPRDGGVRTACAGMLVRQIHEHLSSNLRAEVAYRGEPEPPAGTPIPQLIAGRDALFEDDAYHIDVSHLASTVRYSPLLTDTEMIALATELTDYGRRLSERHVFEGDPPFEDVYKDHGIYLGALIGRDVQGAVDHFRAKLPTPAAPGEAEGYDPAPAQVLVALLDRLGRLDEAIDVAAEHLAAFPESSLFCAGVSQLCQRAGRPERLARVAREQGDLVQYATAILLAQPPSAPAESR